jgi:NAD(P)-dependent dehydrogenase (short-subunit alcohol dehydrogenase family)
MELENSVILITGGAVRVGRAITLELATAGATLFCHYNKSKREAQSLKSEILHMGGNIHLIQGDLSRISDAEGMVDTVFEQAKRIDVLINNAALFFKTPLGAVTEEQWDKLFQLNLKASFFCAQRAGQYMLQQREGKMINIADASGDSPWPSFIPYGLTKAGVISMTKGLAKALAPDIQVNCVNPGPVLIPEYYSQQERKRAIEHTLLKKEGSAQDIAAAVRFLLEGSDYITGTVLNVDGGRSIR